MQIAPHNNLGMSNQTVAWYQLDSEALYKKNLRHQKSILEKFGWLDRDICYRFNSHGFRSEEFDDSGNSMISLGCSHTFGIGLPNELIWNSVVSTALGLKNYNLGIGGSSNDTAFRLANHYIPLLRPQVVIFLSTERSRFELNTADNTIEDLGVWNTFQDAKQFWQHWITNDLNSNMNYEKNQLAIKAICQQHGVKYLHIEALSVSLLDYARDLQHYGPKTHKGIANKILKSL